MKLEKQTPAYLAVMWAADSVVDHVKIAGWCAMAWCLVNAHVCPKNSVKERSQLCTWSLSMMWKIAGVTIASGRSRIVCHGHLSLLSIESYDGHFLAEYLRTFVGSPKVLGHMRSRKSMTCFTIGSLHLVETCFPKLWNHVLMVSWFMWSYSYTSLRPSLKNSQRSLEHEKERNNEKSFKLRN